ncbi:MAG: isoprenylcysteine carboxylmethyltransferase family protein [Chloroflexi bacterium]|nr:isoprenylcysteine carboxylmethyltransferase family protein [Chloroflexota bacterium]
MKLILFSLGTLILTYISRASLKQPRSHGFYRFFAWESILALFLVNVNFWFRDPLAWNQLIAWTLLAVSLIPLGLGLHSLKTRGRPNVTRAADASLLAFEKTTQLVVTGIYRYIRHPLYSSLLLLTWGIFFKAPSLVGGALAVAATIFLVYTAKADEEECVRYFGQEYLEYIKRTRRFIPLIY